MPAIAIDLGEHARGDRRARRRPDRRQGRLPRPSWCRATRSLPLIGDLKTGWTSLDYSINGYAIQLAGYRFADAIYVQGADPNGAEDLRLSMPELDEHVGLIIHAPATSTAVTVPPAVDLSIGRAGLELALRRRALAQAHRRRRHRSSTTASCFLEQLQASVELTKIGGLINALSAAIPRRTAEQERGRSHRRGATVGY